MTCAHASLTLVRRQRGSPPETSQTSDYCTMTNEVAMPTVAELALGSSGGVRGGDTDPDGRVNSDSFDECRATDGYTQRGRGRCASWRALHETRGRIRNSAAFTQRMLQVCTHVARMRMRNTASHTILRHAERGRADGYDAVSDG